MNQTAYSKAVVFSLGAMLALAQGVSAVVVDSLSDVLDGDVSSHTALESTPGPDGKISLREAIAASNNTPGADIITFATPGTIDVLSELPALADAAGGTSIDGAGQIVLNNASGLTTIDGLDVTSENNIIRNLAIQGFANGIHIHGAAAKFNLVAGCTVGGQRTGEGQLLNGNSNGIQISDAASLNSIGGAFEGGGNVLSNNAIHGLILQFASENTVVRNRIGTTPDGLSAAPNGLSGVVINVAHSNSIGGSDTIDGNLISGNIDNGILILNESTLNVIRNNTIGLSPDKFDALPNGRGILIGSSSTQNTIGGSVFGTANFIGGNTGDGITIQNAGNNTIAGNVIGSNYDDEEDTGNGAHGVSISGFSVGNRIGNSTYDGVNTINNNGADGVLVDGVNSFSTLISQNELFKNGGQEIRIANGAQQAIAPPVLSPIPLGGAAFGTTIPNGVVELFELGEYGNFFLERIIADGSGEFTGSIPLIREQRILLMATVTDENSNTSAFGLPQAIPVTFYGTPDQALELYLDYDDNRDEGLSLAEFQAGTGRDSDTFAAIDANSDGSVSYRELMSASVLESGFDALEVNTLSDTADAPDASSREALLSDPGADGKISLREALLAEASGNSDVITFSVSGTIQPGTELPPLGPASFRVHIDGGGTITLDGGLLSGEESGLTVLGNSAHLFGLEIVNFPGAGIELRGSDSFFNHIVGCRIGTDGSSALGNDTGVLIAEGSGSNRIGGGLSVLSNVISGNQNGITIEGDGTNFNALIGNLIGVNEAGAAAIPNVKNGVQLSNNSFRTIFLSFARYNAPNVIAGNGDGTGDGGISVNSGSHGNYILGCVIGQGVNGTSLGNNPHGIRVSGGAHSTIIGLDEVPEFGDKLRAVDGLKEANAKGLVMEDFIAPNVITGNAGHGIQIDGEASIVNLMLFNSIFANGGDAIDLTNNANEGVVAPVITAVDVDSVAGTGSAFALVQLFGDEADEARVFLGHATCDSIGNWSVDTGGKGSGIAFYTATLTDLNTNTSALSEAVAVDDTPPLCPDPESDGDGDGATDCDEEVEGTDPELPDTDGDGMPDGFEIEFALNPLSGADAFLDNDNDFLSNLEEFLGGTNPNVADNVDVTLHVDSEIGVDAPENGAEDNPLRTIFAAMTRALAEPGTVEFVRLAPGDYDEDVNLVAGVTLSGPAQTPEEGDEAFILGVVMGAEGATVEDVTILSADGTETLLNLDSGDMIVRRVLFVGPDTNRAGTGVLAQGSAAATGLIDDCDFVDLGIGVEITGGLPVVRKSVFQDPGIAGIAVRATADVGGDEGLSTSLDSGSGFNTFAFDPAAENPVAEPVAVLNETDVDLRMENNDWGTDDDDAVSALIQGGADFSPKLASGSAILASTVIVTVFDSKSQARVTNASTALEVSGFRPVTENENGVYAFPAVIEGGYSILGSATGFNPGSTDFSVGSAEIKSVVLPMDPAGGEGEGEGEGEKDPNASAFCGPGGAGASGRGDLVLVLLLSALLLTGLGVAGAREGSAKH